VETSHYATFSADSNSLGVDTSGGETDGDTEHEDENEVLISAPEISQNHQVVSSRILV
jgi:hypothetical protein